MPRKCINGHLLVSKALPELPSVVFIGCEHPGCYQNISLALPLPDELPGAALTWPSDGTTPTPGPR